MSPFIKDSDIITVSPLHSASPNIGDVVAFISPGIGRLVIHRVVGKRGKSYFIKGDNIPGSDGLVPEAIILGCISKVERNGKDVFFGLGPERFLIAFLTRWGFLFHLLVPVWRLVRSIFFKKSYSKKTSKE